jgi:hypothetical protein
VLLIVRPEAVETYRARFSERESWPDFDWWVTSLPELEPIAATWGEPMAWEIFCNERYSFADVSVLVDKTGQVQQLVNEKGANPEEQRQPIVYEMSKQRQRSRSSVGSCGRDRARPDGHHALEGRHRPYYGYLARELEARLLTTFPLPADDLLAMIDTILATADPAKQQRLLGITDPIGRQAGCDEVFDEWGTRYAWMQQYRPDDPFAMGEGAMPS